MSDGEQTITSSGQRNMGNRLKEKNEAIKAGGDDRNHRLLSPISNLILPSLHSRHAATGIPPAHTVSCPVPSHFASTPLTIRSAP